MNPEVDILYCFCERIVCTFRHRAFQNASVFVFLFFQVGLSSHVTQISRKKSCLAITLLTSVQTELDFWLWLSYAREECVLHYSALQTSKIFVISKEYTESVCLSVLSKELQINRTFLSLFFYFYVFLLSEIIN